MSTLRTRINRQPILHTLSCPDSLAEPIKIELDDPIAEHSSSVLFFLSLISGKQLEDILRMFPLKMVLTFHAVMLFVKKWDCMLASNMMDMWLIELARSRHLHREIKPLDVFIIAAKADKVLAAEHVVMRYKRAPVTRPITL
ncbi:hypothetical protein, variant 2 [Cryptococcus amylolentus CBS 6039]|uniref:Uncharacterized protein n=2 Tax=Cryptococcus amylolentus TaxID=104669 RepID=A0A1E3HI67_9TREE|nr:hypothetical protein L202_05979 [Cryptococcus amylolentus CBS 6039]XP_018991555.1 hypothetical protein, variant 1 [Cryptococcus amylolentus CBS 6039]XP_018991556.1 hypothetical protein, variant 2 [Cryptococcus amylolentus CBS 6039]ODN76023.1 hypothetical protein L202_05979 [Cryptococcus amylolentus CBS 6039]ODN76024.1 hypothetical protein, variant 1 [Cryptococcus amylolentus CBS 6039]ODN76025.1 hypothetical protein, variant 2 [Cryptococcus amylolentus CBS 6039]